jgi:hypothetical protein
LSAGAALAFGLLLEIALASWHFDRIYLFFCGERDPHPVIWVFLARSRFAAETAVHNYWILLDFLGFSRPNLDFSMGYTGFSLKKFSRPLPWTFEPPERTAADEVCKGRLVHAASLTLFLILRNWLSRQPFRFRRLRPKAGRFNWRGRA